MLWDDIVHKIVSRENDLRFCITEYENIMAHMPQKKAA
jgi:hypothetical protein